MATTRHGNYEVTGSAAVTTLETTRWPVIATKEAMLQLMAAGPSNPYWNDLLMRLSNTDITDWDADKGSYAR